MVVREGTAKSMRSNRSTGSSIELKLRKALWAANVRGYRTNVRALPGTPDIVFNKKRVAVFVHGCYWHSCPKCRKDANFNTNERFWREKLAANVARDAENERRLQEIDFQVFIVWECEVKQNLAACVQRVQEALGMGKSI